MNKMREQYEYLLKNEREINQQLNEKVEYLQEKLEEETLKKIEETKEKSHQEIQTENISKNLVDNSCQTIKEDNSNSSIVHDPSYKSILSIKSTVNNGGKLRDMQEQMMNLQEKVIELKVLNKTLKREGSQKGNMMIVITDLSI